MSTDINFISFTGEVGGSVDLPDAIYPDAGISDALKLSNCRDFTVNARMICGGKEDVVDINRGSNLQVRIGTASPCGKYVATIKGGAENVLLTIDKLCGHGTETDIDIGNWSDQEPHKRTKFVFLNIKTDDGSPVKVRVLHGWRPIILNSEQKYIIDAKYKGVFNFVYSILKKWKLA